MDTEEDFGIFLFKDSKSKISDIPVVVSEDTTTTTSDTTPAYSIKYAKKWMGSFLHRFSRPYQGKPVQAIDSAQIIAYAQKIYEITPKTPAEVQLKQKKTRKVTRGNRRHRVETRKQRNSRKLSKSKSGTVTP